MSTANRTVARASRLSVAARPTDQPTNRPGTDRRQPISGYRPAADSYLRTDIGTKITRIPTIQISE